jgi:CheY-like chemotaxis protein
MPTTTLTRLGIGGWLNKPVRQSELFDALVELRNRGRIVSGAVASTSPSVVSSPTAARLLLAEDNPVNQEVARSMLEVMGYDVTVVGDGETALRAATNQRFDLILMDCQMPRLDGYAATVRLREFEATQNTGARPIPVIALTANAMVGDRERCLAAGMNDYMSKPFSQQQLRNTVEQWLAPESTDTAVEAAVSHGNETIIDCTILEQLRALSPSGDSRVLNTVLSRYLESTPPLFAALKRAAETLDAVGLQRAAHSLKSSSANVGALYVAKLLTEVESCALGGQLTDIAVQVKMIASALEAATLQLDAIRRTAGPS